MARARTRATERQLARAQRRLAQRLRERDEAERDVAYYSALLADLEDQVAGVKHETIADGETRTASDGSVATRRPAGEAPA